MSELFDTQSNSQTTEQTGTITPPAVVAPIVPEELHGLVGEGKKYATMEAALASVPHSQAHIARLEAEMAELRKSAAAAGAAGEAYAAVQELLKEMKATPSAPAGGTVLSETQVAAMLDRKLVERENQRSANENLKSVESALVSKFGDKAPDWYKSRAEELGVGPETISSLAARSPKAALELLGVTHHAKDRPSPSTPGLSSERLGATPSSPEGIKSTMGGKARPIDLWHELAQKYK